MSINEILVNVRSHASDESARVALRLPKRFGAWLSVVCALLSLLLPVAVGAAEIDPESGFRLAEELCADCHRTGWSLLSSPNPAAPPFIVIANEPSITDIAVRTLLRTSHQEMPNLILTDEQITDLVAYIRSLKTP